MLILPVHSQNIRYNNQYAVKKNTHPIFSGKTNFYALTDIHQNAEKHCKMIFDILKKSDKSKTIILDNGDIFNGLFPKYTLMHTYSRAKKAAPELEIVYNIGNNDPGFMETEKVLFQKYLNILHRSGVKTISANVIDETTGKPPKGIKPYAIVERDGDKLLYVGFVIDKLKQAAVGMKTINPIEALKKLAPQLKNVMNKEKCKGLVFMLHDDEKMSNSLLKTAKELGLNPEFIVGGHVHHGYIDKINKIFYPEPFGKSMLNFDLNIDKTGHSIQNVTEILSDDCSELGIFANEINKAKLYEKFDEPIAKSVTSLKHKYQPEFNMTFSQLGTFYADGIREISNSDVGFIPKSWMYDTLAKKNDNITKLDILTSFPRPFKNIVQVQMKPDELRDFFQKEIDKKGKLYDASQNFELTIDKNNQIRQIYINGNALFNLQGKPVNPKSIYKVALSAHTAEKVDCPRIELRKTMFDGIVHGLKKISKEFKTDQEYPVTKLNIQT